MRDTGTVSAVLIKEDEICQKNFHRNRNKGFDNSTGEACRNSSLNIVGTDLKPAVNVGW